MKKIFSILVGLGILAVALIVVVVFTLPDIIQSDVFKLQIVQAVKQQTGRDLSIEGELDLDVFPKIGLVMGKTELSNAVGFDDRPFAHVSAVHIRLALLPLLSKQVKVDEVVVEGLFLNLHRNKAGQANWDNFFKDADGQADQQSSSPQHDAEAGLGSLYIGGINIRDAQISWQDDTTGEAYRISELNLTGGAIMPGQSTSIDFSAHFASQSHQAGGMFRLTGDVLFSEADQSITMNGAVLEVDGVRHLLEALGVAVPETVEPAMLTHIKADFDIMASGQRIAMEHLDIAIDDTTLKGRVDITDVSQQAVTFELDIDQIDLGRYLLTSGAGSGPRPQSNDAGVTGDEPLLPVEALRKLNANGTAHIAHLAVNNIKADDVELELKSADGRINLETQADLYQGEHSGSFAVDVLPEVPVFEIRSDFNNIHVESLLKDLTEEARLAGIASGFVDVRGEGNSQNTLKKTLHGNASFNFKDGAVIGVNVAGILREGMAMLEGRVAQKTDLPEKTDFSQLSGKATIERGVLSNKDLSMKSPLLRAVGSGTVDLNREQVDYLLETSLVGSLQGQGGEDLSKLKGITIPLRIKGPFSDLSYKPDLSGTLSERARQKVQQKKDDLEDKLKGRLKELF